MGYNIALSGCIVFLAALAIIKIDGRPAELVPFWRVCTLVIIELASTVAMFVGSLMVLCGL